MAAVKILIIDDDESSQSALLHVLDAEGWQVSVAPLAREGLARLARAPWTLVIVNVALVDVEGPMFDMLKALAQAQPAPDQPRVSVLFLVPQLLAPVAKPVLEAHRLPFALKPIHLHDFLERVSDLLLEAKSIPDPIRQVKQARAVPERRKTRERRGPFDRRLPAMFASRKEYFMTEEEIAEFEKQEEEERKKREEAANVKDLGAGKR